MEGAVSSSLATRQETSVRDSAVARIGVVTGGNKGIGFEVCRQLDSSGVTVVLTARDETRGAEAVDKLTGLGLPDVIFHQLDVTDALSISRLADFLKSRFGRLDILVNNAAISAVELVDDPSVGPQPTVEKLFRSDELKQELNGVDNLDEDRLDELLDAFIEDFEAGAVEARGWPAEFSAYKVAKAAMNAYSRVLRVNCVDPGYVRTDMTRNSGLLAPEEAGARVVAVALLPEGGPTGAFFDDDGKETSFV